MDRETYLKHVRDLLSGEPDRVRDANRTLYGALVGGDPLQAGRMTREADLVLAEVPQRC